MKIYRTPNLWNLAKKLIPGGNGLLSKRPNRYLPEYWPTYFKEAKGINIKTLNNKNFIDMSNMGVGASILGYSNTFVNKKVKKAIDKGISTTLNCKEEYELAKEFLKHDKFAKNVKFARSGGEAMSIAIRIARANSKNDKIAFSGYHGWHDWYLATNLKGKENLKEHLLPGLNPLGVPKALKNTVIPFRYNNIKDFKKIISRNKLAAVVVEGSRFEYPKKDFIKEINNFCKKKKVCLIIDEITSGWRETIGGVYKSLGFNPDIVVYGKGIGNGYAISAIVGKSKLMRACEDTFISSTAWTERVGFVSALATINFFKKRKVHKHIKKIGNYLISNWIKLAKKNNLEISTNKFVALSKFEFNYKNKNNYLNTLFTQEMLKEGYLATNSVYISYSHKKKDIDKYLKSCDKVFKKIYFAQKTNKNYLYGEVKSMGFKRLT